MSARTWEWCCQGEQGELYLPSIMSTPPSQYLVANVNKKPLMYIV
jgi:hypothetical protein